MTKKYPVQTIKTPHKIANITFAEDCVVINDGLEMTPMTFSFFNNQVVLSLDKTNEWNAQCGHRLPNEAVADCLKRESYEEAGVQIVAPHRIGVMEYKTEKNTLKDYPPITYIPVYISEATKITPLPIDSEVKMITLADYDKAVGLLSQRNDNGLLCEIFKKAWQVFYG